MKLEGSLDAFSLPDVFQLLSLTKKSGGLHLANGQVCGHSPTRPYACDPNRAYEERDST